MIDGDRVRREIWIGAPPEAVFDMFVQSDHITRWLGPSAQLDPRPGGVFRFEVSEGQFCSGEFVVVDRPQRLVFTWGWEGTALPVAPGSTEVEVRLFEADGGTRLVLEHGGVEEPYRLLHDEGWSRYLPRLQAVMAGEDPGRSPAEESPAAALDRLGTNP